MLVYLARSWAHDFPHRWKASAASAVSVFLILLVMGFLDGAQRSLLAQSALWDGRVRVTAAHFGQAVTIEQAAESLTRLVRPAAVAEPRLSVDAAFRARSGISDPCRLVGVSDFTGSDWSRGLILVEGRWPLGDREVVVPDILEKKLGLRLGQALKISGRNRNQEINTMTVRVCGVYEGFNIQRPSTSFILCPLGAVEEFYGAMAEDCTYLLNFQRGLGPEDLPAELLSQRSARTGAEGPRMASEVISPFDVTNPAIQFQIFLAVVSGMLLVILLSVVAIIDFGVSMNLVNLRGGQVGALLSIGVPASMVAGLLVAEGLADLLVSALIGAGAAAAVCGVLEGSRPTWPLDTLVGLMTGSPRLAFDLSPISLWMAMGFMAGALLLAMVPGLTLVLTRVPAKFLKS